MLAVRNVATEGGRGRIWSAGVGVGVEVVVGSWTAVFRGILGGGGGGRSGWVYVDEGVVSVKTSGEARRREGARMGKWVCCCSAVVV